MVKKTITNTELLELVAEGAEISLEKEQERPPEPVVISQMAILLADVKRIADANEAIAKKQFTVLETLLKKLTVEMTRDKMNIEPIVSILNAIKTNTTSVRQPYVFHIERDQRNLIKTVEAIPTERIIN